MKRFAFTLLGSAFLAFPASAQNTANQVPQAQRDLILNGATVFQSDEGGPFVTQNFSAYRVRYLLTKDNEPLYFNYRINGSSVTYRVAWIAEPSFAYRNLAGSTPVPIPPFFQQYRSQVFAVGIAMGLPENSPVAGMTTWLPIAELKLRTQP